MAKGTDHRLVSELMGVVQRGEPARPPVGIPQGVPLDASDLHATSPSLVCVMSSPKNAIAALVQHADTHPDAVTYAIVMPQFCAAYFRRLVPYITEVRVLPKIISGALSTSPGSVIKPVTSWPAATSEAPVTTLH